MTSIALNKLDEILKLPLDQHDEIYPVLLRVQMSATTTALNTQVKVDEQRLKRRQADRLPDILRRLGEEERAMKVVS